MIRMVFSRSNWPMRRLAGTANARLDLTLDEISAEIPVGHSLRLSTAQTKGAAGSLSTIEPGGPACAAGAPLPKID
jgi:hypothetical protein